MCVSRQLVTEMNTQWLPDDVAAWNKSMQELGRVLDETHEDLKMHAFKVKQINEGTLVPKYASSSLVLHTKLISFWSEKTNKISENANNLNYQMNKISNPWPPTHLAQWQTGFKALLVARNHVRDVASALSMDYEAKDGLDGLAVELNEAWLTWEAGVPERKDQNLFDEFEVEEPKFDSESNDAQAHELINYCLMLDA